MRWTGPDQWHVTLRFLGDADPAEVAAATAGGLSGLPEADARLGPATALLGRGVLQVPAAGLDTLAGAVVSSTRLLGQAPREGPFRGHLTLARSKRPGPLRRLAGAPLASSWRVRSVTLVSSVQGRAGSLYSVLERFPLHP